VKKGRLTIIILSAVLIIALLTYFIISSFSEKKYSWYENYDHDNKQPYGTSFIIELLKAHTTGKFVLSDKKPLKELLKDNSFQKNTSYIFIGESLFLDEEDRNALKQFVESGNDAFFATLEVPNEALNGIYQAECTELITYDNNKTYSVNMNFYHNSLRKENSYRFVYRVGSEDRDYYWDTFSDQMFCDVTKAVIPLGYQTPDRVNFIKIPYGKGNVYVHSNPIAFTNYFLTKQDKLEYASAVFSHLKGKNIIWDEFSKIPFAKNPNREGGPLDYILQQPSLRYAWWMLLLTIGLYVFFAAKRTQRVIPVLEPKTNTSLEYIKLISALHYQNGSHTDMAKKKMKYFLYFIRSKYGIHNSHFTEQDIRKLADKSKVNYADVHSIFNQYSIIERNAYGNIDAGRLLDLFNAIEYFYKNCK
jgi:hypothetical protein